VLTLYQVEWCPYCHIVRQTMTELGLTYITVNVPARREERAELVALTDQAAVPALQDGDRLVIGTDDVVEYLRATYPAPPDAEDHAVSGAWRAAGFVSLAPRAALARLRELLEEAGFTIVTQIRGPKISERLPKEYVLLGVSAPAAAVKAIEIDALAPNAVMFLMAVMPAENGSVVATADPVGNVWLYGEVPLTKVQSAVKKRLAEVFEKL